MQRFFMVYVEGSNGCRVKHITLKSAQTEAVRLARLSENIGRKVYIMEAISYCLVESLPVIFYSLKV